MLELGSESSFQCVFVSFFVLYIPLYFLLLVIAHTVMLFTVMFSCISSSVVHIDLMKQTRHGSML
jgi:hypothetical protein